MRQNGQSEAPFVLRPGQGCRSRDGIRRSFMRIRAAVLDRMGAAPPYAVSKPLRIAEVELDPPGRGEVLVRIAAAGLCHSDLSVINGDRPRPVPMALGHEAAGGGGSAWRGRAGLGGGRSRRDGVHAVLRPLRPVRGRPAGAVRAGGCGQRRRNPAVPADGGCIAMASRSITISAARRSPSMPWCPAGPW